MWNVESNEDNKVTCDIDFTNFNGPTNPITSSPKSHLLPTFDS